MWCADAVHAEQPEREQHAVAQVRDGEDVLQAVVHASCSVAPPAAAIFSAALPLNLCACTVSALPTSPRASTFTPLLAAADQAVLAQQLRRHDGAGVEPLGRACRGSPPRTRRGTDCGTRASGTRRCSGIWPPSNPRLNLKPERDFAPLWPRPAVLPLPDPWPRPIRFFACFMPLGGSQIRSDCHDVVLLRPRRGDAPCESCRASPACPSAPTVWRMRRRPEALHDRRLVAVEPGRALDAASP